MVWIVESVYKGHPERVAGSGAYATADEGGSAFLALYDFTKRALGPALAFEFDREAGEGYYESPAYVARLFPAAMRGPNV